MYSIKKVDDSEKVEELALLRNKVDDVRLQDKLGQQNFHEDIKKLYQPLTDTIENPSEKLTKTITETSIKNNQAISDLNEKLLELMNDRRLIAHYLAFSFVNFFKPENKSQSESIKDHNSTWMIVFLINTIISDTLYSNMLTVRDNK